MERVHNEYKVVKCGKGGYGRRVISLWIIAETSILDHPVNEYGSRQQMYASLKAEVVFSE
jgi:hypothetical protein